MPVNIYSHLTPAPPELTKKAFSLLDKVKYSGGKIRRGIHGTTNAVKNGDAKLVYIVSDLEYPEQVLHLKVLCERDSIPYVCVPANRQYGIVNSAAIIDIGRARSPYYRFLKELDMARRLL